MSFQYVSKNWRQLSWSSQFFNFSINVQRVGSNSSGSFFIEASNFYQGTRTLTRLSFMALSQPASRIPARHCSVGFQWRQGYAPKAARAVNEDALMVS